MGVGRENKDIFFGPYVQQNDMHALESQSSGQSTDEEDVHHPPSPSRGPLQSSPRRRFHGARHRSASLEACLTGMYRRCGSRQARRTEHIRHLLSLKGDGEESSEVLTPTYGPHNSPFAQLLQNRHKMQAWNDFINSSEEDQERILEMRTKGLSLASIREESDEEDVWEKVEAPDKDKRSVHPSYTGAECFQRVDRNLQSMLTCRQLPLELVWQLEQQMVEFFRNCPGSVYVSHLTSSYECLALHAVCQYLNLTCRSHEDGGQRRTQVENRIGTFNVPSQSLTEFLRSS